MLPKKHKAVAIGDNHYLVKDPSGKVSGYSSSTNEQLEIIHLRSDAQFAPIPLRGQTVHKVLATEDMGFIQTEHDVLAFGCNFANKLGMGFSTERIQTPTSIPKLQDKVIVDVTSSHYTTFILTEQGELLKLGGFNCNSEFINIKATQIASGDLHNLALTVDGQLFVYGTIHKNQFGLNHIKDDVQGLVVPSSIQEPIVGIAAGALFSAFLTQSGTVYIGGYIKMLQQSIPPTPVVFPNNIVIESIQAKERFLVAKSTCGKLYRWRDYSQELVHGNHNIPQATLIQEINGKVLEFDCNRERIFVLNNQYQLQVIDADEPIPALPKNITATLCQAYIEQHLANNKDFGPKLKNASSTNMSHLSDLNLLFFANSSPSQNVRQSASTLDIEKNSL